MIEKDLFGFLSAALGHDRIYPLVLPQKCTLPAVVYQRIGSPDELTADGVADLVEGRFQLDSYAATYGEARAMSLAVRLTLSGYRGQMGQTRVDSARRDGASESYEPETKRFRASDDYIIFYEE